MERRDGNSIEPDRIDVEVECVEHDAFCRLHHREVNVDTASEACRNEVGFELESIPRGHDGTRQPVRIAGHGERGYRPPMHG